MGNIRTDALPPTPVGLLHRRRGDSCRPPTVFTSRLLHRDDLKAVRELHRVSRATLAPHMVALDHDDFLAARLGPRGIGLGLFLHEQMIAYTLLGLSAHAGGEMGRFIAGGSIQKALVAELDGIGVLPEWHGNGLQRLMLHWRFAASHAIGRQHVLTTVSPFNTYSLKNLLEAGLRPTALCKPYDDTWRYVLHADVARPVVEPTHEVRWLLPVALEEQLALLEQGWRGCGYRVNDGWLEIGFEPRPQI